MTSLLAQRASSLRGLWSMATSSSATAASSSSTASASAAASAPSSMARLHRNPSSLRSMTTTSIRRGLGGSLSSHSLSVVETPSPPPSSAAATHQWRPPSMASRKERRQVKKKAQKNAKKAKKENTLAAQMGLKQETVSPFVRVDRQFKTFKPLTPSLRWVRYNLNPHLHKGSPERSLTRAKRSTGGRNHHGHVTVRGRGGGVRRRIRLVDFYRWEAGSQEVIRIEYDPGRSAHIALVKHKETGKQSYILAPEGLRAGDTVESYRTNDAVGGSGAEGSVSALDLGIFRTKAIRAGNVLPLHLIPIGTMIHAISLMPNGPAKLVRSAGSSGQLIAFTNRSKAQKTPLGEGSSANENTEEDEAAATAAAAAEGEAENGATNSAMVTTSHAQVKLQSGEVRLVPVNCCAAIGRVSNIDHQHVRLGKAGRSRWLGRRPKVRGVAMNKVDHPHGGGRGKSKSNLHPRSKWGVLQGKRTRKPGGKKGNKMVVRERPRGRASKTRA